MAEKEPLINTAGGKLVSAFVLGRPVEAKKLLDTGDAAKFSDAVCEFMLPFNIDDIKRIHKWITSEFARLNGAGDDAGKKQPAA
jgi:hypothetical protein